MLEISLSIAVTNFGAGSPSRGSSRLIGTLIANFDLRANMHLTQDVYLVGVLPADFDGNGELDYVRTLMGSIPANFDLDGVLRISQNLEADLPANTFIRGHIYPPVALRGDIPANFDLSSALTVERALVGELPADFDIDGDLVIQQQIDRVLLVGAGGAGGAQGNSTQRGGGGGGGGGQVLIDESPFLLPVGEYFVQVGMGSSNSNGGDSSFADKVAKGGGRAGSGTLAPLPGGPAGGGSWLGGGGVTGADGDPGGDGGDGYAPANSAGGGGASTAANGANATNTRGGDGADGVADDITGAPVTYGGGGAGAGYSTRGQGGDGGGGDGGQSTSVNGQPGTDGLGGGGGGQRYNSTTGVRGGHGIVVIRYAGAPKAEGGVITTVGGDTVHTFTQSGTFTLLERTVVQVDLVGEVPVDTVMSGNIVTTKKLEATLAANFDLVGTLSEADADAMAIIEAMETTPIESRQTLIKDTVVSLKTAGLWGKIKFMNVLAAHDAQAARIDWVLPSRVGTEVGTLNFSPDIGYQAAAEDNFIDSGYTFDNIDPLSIGLTAKVSDSNSPASTIVPFGWNGGGTTFTERLSITAAGEFGANISSGSSTTVSAAGSIDTIFSGQRSADTVTIFWDGSTQTSEVISATATDNPSPENMSVAGNRISSTDTVNPVVDPHHVQLAVVHDFLTNTELADLHSILQNYINGLPATAHNYIADPIIAAMTVAPSPEREALIRQTVGDLVSTGLWNKMDLLYFAAAHDQQAATVNWMDPAGTKLDVPAQFTFTEDHGFVSTGTGIIGTGYAPSDLNHYSQQFAHIGLWNPTDVEAFQAIYANDSGSSFLQLSTRATGARLKINEGSSSANYSFNAVTGHFIGNLDQSGGVVRGYHNGIQRFSVVPTSNVAEPTTEIGLLSGSLSTNSGMAVAHIGGALTPAEITDLHTIIKNYVNTVTAESAADELISTMSPAPSPERETLIRQTVSDLVVAGLWDKIKFMNVYAAHAVQPASIDWVNPSRLATAVNGPIFTVDEGYKSDGDGYIDTMYALEGIGDNHGLTTKVLEPEVPGTGAAVAGGYTGGGTPGVDDFASRHFLTNVGSMSIANASSSAAITIPASNLVFTSQREDASNIALYGDGAQLGTAARTVERNNFPSQVDMVATAAVSNTAGAVGSFLTSHTTQLVIWHDTLTAQEVEDLNMIMKAYFASISTGQGAAFTAGFIDYEGTNEVTGYGEEELGDPVGTFIGGTTALFDFVACAYIVYDSGTPPPAIYVYVEGNQVVASGGKRVVIDGYGSIDVSSAYDVQYNAGLDQTRIILPPSFGPLVDGEIYIVNFEEV